VNIHASAVVVGEAGVVIRGRSGRGKSALALALIDIANTHGLFGRLVGDDRILVRACGGRILLSGAPNTLSLIERRGIGLETVPFEPAAVARLVVDIRRNWRRSACRASFLKPRAGPSSALAPCWRRFRRRRRLYDAGCSFCLNNTPQCTNMPRFVTPNAAAGGVERRR
jgi:hypothetical protein